MGAGSSGPTVGLPVNPRVEYTDKRSKTDKKSMLIDAPVLVNLQHGTLRYRYQDDLNAGGKVGRRVERPHESQDDLHQKQGYFYHSRLNKFGHEASVDNEQPWKFAYVYKGAERSKQKKIYYVFGKGLQTNQEGFIQPKYQSENGQSFTSTGLYKAHGHVYFDLHFLKQDAESEESEGGNDDRQFADEMGPETEPTITELVVRNSDRVSAIRHRLGIRLTKPATHIHIFHRGEELRQDQQLGPMRTATHGKWKRFTLLLHPK